MDPWFLDTPPGPLLLTNGIKWIYTPNQRCFRQRCVVVTRDNSNLSSCHSQKVKSNPAQVLVNRFYIFFIIFLSFWWLLKLYRLFKWWYVYIYIPWSIQKFLPANRLKRSWHPARHTAEGTAGTKTASGVMMDVSCRRRHAVINIGLILWSSMIQQKKGWWSFWTNQQTWGTEFFSQDFDWL